MFQNLRNLNIRQKFTTVDSLLKIVCLTSLQDSAMDFDALPTIDVKCLKPILMSLYYFRSNEIYISY